MGGGVMQLTTYGSQDIYLTGNPQVTFFKVVYRRHTNFSIESVEQNINGVDTLESTPSNGYVTVARNGDLLHMVYITSSTPNIEDGTAIVNDVTLEIGGQRIDKHYKEWNQIWNELTTPVSKSLGLSCMQGGFTGLVTESNNGNGLGMVQIPLNFGFCRNPGLALPMVALQNHEVKLKFTWGTSNSPIVTNPGCGAAAVVQVWCDYIYLDTDERRRFAQVSHEYLIEQLQRNKLKADTKNELHFNHPVKELIWTSAITNAYSSANIQLNGRDRFTIQEEEYFQLKQPYEHHTSIPQTNLPENVVRLTVPELKVLESLSVALCRVGLAWGGGSASGNQTNIAATGANGFNFVDSGTGGGTAGGDPSGGAPAADVKKTIALPAKALDDMKTVNLDATIFTSATAQTQLKVGTNVIISYVDADRNTNRVPTLTYATITALVEGGGSGLAITLDKDISTEATAPTEPADALTMLLLPPFLDMNELRLSIEPIVAKVGKTYPTGPPQPPATLAGTEGAVDGVANGFATCSEDGGSSTATGKHVIIDADTLGINAGDLHLVAHCDADKLGSTEYPMFASIKTTYARVVSFNDGLLEYDRVVTTVAASAPNDQLSIFKIIYPSRCSRLSKKINVYSFALRPEEHQPSGTCNFSRLDNATLITTGSLSAEDNIYAVNYNVLRIMSGMGGLAYSS